MKGFVQKLFTSFKALLKNRNFVTPSRRSRLKSKVVVKKKKLTPKKAYKVARKPSAKKSIPRRPSKPKKVKKAAVTNQPSVKKVTKSASAKVTPKVVEPKMQLVGEVTHYFSRIRVIVLKVTSGPVTVGDTLQIKGKTTDFIQPIKSLQIESVDVKSARKGQLAGLKVNKEARPGDKVYKVL